MKKWKPLVQFTSLSELEQYILTNNYEGALFVDNNRKCYMRVEQSDSNSSKFILDLYYLSPDVQGIIRNNSVLLDAELDYYYYGCGYLECEMQKDKFEFIFNSLIQGGRLYYSVNNN